jgi:hypothetical protein
MKKTNRKLFALSAKVLKRNNTMPTDTYKYTLETQKDSSIKGNVTYYYEQWSMYNSDEDGLREKDCNYKDLKSLYKELLNDYHRPDVTLDGVKIIHAGQPTAHADPQYYTQRTETPCACDQGLFITRWEPNDMEGSGYDLKTKTSYKEILHYKKFIAEVTCPVCIEFYVYRGEAWTDVRPEWNVCATCKAPVNPKKEVKAFRCSACISGIRQGYTLTYRCKVCGISVVQYDRKRKTYDCLTCKKRQPNPPEEVHTPRLIFGENEIQWASYQDCSSCKKKVQEQDIYILCENCAKTFQTKEMVGVSQDQ